MKFFLFLFGCLMKILGFGTVNIKSERTRHRIWLGSAFAFDIHRPICNMLQTFRFNTDDHQR